MVKRRIVILAEPDLKRIADINDELIEGVWVSVDVAKSATIRSFFQQVWQEEKCLQSLRGCPVESLNFILKGRRLNLESSAFDLVLDGDEISIRYRHEDSPASPVPSRKRKRSELPRSSEKKPRHKKGSPERIAHDLMKLIQPGYLVKVVSSSSERLSLSERSSEKRILVNTGKVVKIVASDKTFYLVLKKRETNVTLTLDVRTIREVYTLQGTREVKVYEKDHSSHSHKVIEPKNLDRFCIDIPLGSFPPSQTGLAHPAIGNIDIPDAIWASQNLNHLNSWLDSELERIKRRVRRQIEYYFSDQNYLSDTYLQSLHKKFPDGIPLEKIARFNCIREMTHDLQLIREACSGTPANFHLTQDNRLIRRETRIDPPQVKNAEPEPHKTDRPPHVATVEESSPASAGVVLKLEPSSLPSSNIPSSSGNSGLAAFLQYVNEMGATWAQRPNNEVPIKCEQDASLPASEKPAPEAPPTVPTHVPPVSVSVTPAPETAPISLAKRFSNPLLD